MSSNWKNLFLGSAQSRELKDTLELHRKVAAIGRTPFRDTEQLEEILVDLIAEICEQRGVAPTLALGNSLWDALTEFLYLAGFLIDLPDEAALHRLSAVEGIELRATYRHFLLAAAGKERLFALWREKLVALFSGILAHLPPSAFIDVGEQDGSDAIVLPEAQALDLCENLQELLDRLLITILDDDIGRTPIFESLADRIEGNIRLASGISQGQHNVDERKIVLPGKAGKKSPEYLVDTYLIGTPFRKFFYSRLPFAIPFPARFEHTHVVGGTGHGKTQLLQFLIHHDLLRSQEDGRSVVVIDSQGDLIRTISRLAYFSPSAKNSLADRFVLIDPTDIDFPACLNMFDFNRERLSGYTALDQEKILNATTEIYEYFFGALLGAELTQRQGVIFKYIARLLLEIPGANIHTLRELMEDGERFRPYMEALTGSARTFFATRFFDRQFSETKKQILTRLWGVLSNTSLERMFSHTENKVDLFELLNSGKIVLINTAKELLGQEGTAIFGRFFLTLTAQAAVQRAAIPAYERRPTFIYVDEAKDYFDDNISRFLEQLRKYRLGLIFAHQNMDQLPPALRASVLASTTIKFAGGVSAKDAGTLDAEYRCDAPFLLAQKKYEKHTQFACYVRNYTSKALSVSIPLGHMESLPTMENDEYQALIEQNRARYCAPPVLPEPVSFKKTIPAPKPSKAPDPAEAVPQPPTEQRYTPDMVESPPPTETAPTSLKPSPKPVVAKSDQTPGRGGQQHKYLQQLLKELAQERGFLASIEEPILDGAGRVDVSISRGEQRVAFEISVTTGADHELSNIEKCIAAGYEDIVLIGGTARHAKSLTTFIEKNLEEHERDRVQYLVPDQLMEYFDSLGTHAEPVENTVRGYKVKTVQQSVSPEDASDRRKAIAGVIARSLGKNKA